jgi:hypothetical protein
MQPGRLIALAVIVAATGLACGTTTATPGSGDRPTTSALPGRAASRSILVSEVDGLIANARAAQRQHDLHATRRFQVELIERLGLRAISEARGSYQRAVADLAAATARGDSHSRAGFRAELRATCEPGGLVGAFESCDGDVIVWGG